MYILVRQDLPKPWHPVQACHAVAEYLMKFPTYGWDNGTMVVLSVENEIELLKWKELISENYDVAIFEETYLSEEKHTSLATIGDQKLSNLLASLKLL